MVTRVEQNQQTINRWGRGVKAGVGVWVGVWGCVEEDFVAIKK